MTGLKLAGKFIGGAIGTAVGIIFAAFCVDKARDAANEAYDGIKKKTSKDDDEVEEESETAEE